MSGHKFRRVPALCNECGTQREIAWRTINKGGRYKCETCRRQTSHAIVAPSDWGDYWEKKNLESSQYIGLLQQLTAFIKSKGVYVGEVDDPQGGIAEVRRYVEPLRMSEGDFTDVILINPDLTVSEKIDTLRWAWSTLLPNATWNECTPLRDTSGEVHVGIYRTQGARR